MEFSARCAARVKMAVLLERGNMLSLETCVNAEDLPKIACLFSRNFCIRVNMLHKLKSVLIKIQD